MDQVIKGVFDIYLNNYEKGIVMVDLKNEKLLYTKAFTFSTNSNLNIY
jgi:hypothetical protein